MHDQWLMTTLKGGEETRGVEDEGKGTCSDVNIIRLYCVMLGHTCCIVVTCTCVVYKLMHMHCHQLRNSGRVIIIALPCQSSGCIHTLGCVTLQHIGWLLALKFSSSSLMTALNSTCGLASNRSMKRHIRSKQLQMSSSKTYAHTHTRTVQQYYL